MEGEHERLKSCRRSCKHVCISQRAIMVLYLHQRKSCLPRSQNEDHSTGSACHAGQAAEMSFSEMICRGIRREEEKRDSICCWILLRLQTKVCHLTIGRRACE